MIDFIKSYEARKPKQHLVWLNFGEKEIFDEKCHADIISPGDGPGIVRAQSSRNRKISFWISPGVTRGPSGLQ